MPNVISSRTSDALTAFVRVLVGLHMLLRLAGVLDVLDVFGCQKLTKIQQVQAVSLNKRKTAAAVREVAALLRKMKAAALLAQRADTD